MCVLIFTVSIKLSIYVAMYYKNKQSLDNWKLFKSVGAKVMYLVRHNLIPMDNSGISCNMHAYDLHENYMRMHAMHYIFL